MYFSFDFVLYEYFMYACMVKPSIEGMYFQEAMYSSVCLVSIIKSGHGFLIDLNLYSRGLDVEK